MYTYRKVASFVTSVADGIVSRTLEIHSALTHLITQGYFILLKMSHL